MSDKPDMDKFKQRILDQVDSASCERLADNFRKQSDKTIPPNLAWKELADTADRRSARPMARFSRPIVLVIAVLYGYGGLVHLANMAGLSGYDWLDAPSKWQVLDLIYLSLDFVVCVGLLRGWRIAAPAFFIANLSQIALYTLGARWVMNVPAEFLSSGHEMSLGSLVGFHLVTLVLMGLALRLGQFPGNR